MSNLKKVFVLALLVVLHLPLIVSAGETEPKEPTKVVLFPFRRAVFSTIVDTSVKEYYVKEGEKFSTSSR